jgi:hypothetical protein
MTLRVLMVVERMSLEFSLAWIRKRLAKLRNRAGSAPLIYDQVEMDRVLNATARAVANGNGYQKDPKTSTATLLSAKEAWERSGFRLSDESTWDRSREATRIPADLRTARGPRLVWTARLWALLPRLAELLHTDYSHARRMLEAVCRHVDTRSELASSFLQGMMAEVGVKAYRDKATALKRLLVAEGIILQVKRGFRYGDGTGVGTFYDLARDLYFRVPQDTQQTVSTYRTFGGLDTSPLVASRRRKQTLDRYFDRLRALGWHQGYLAA